MEITDLITPEYQQMNSDIYNTSKRSMGGAKHSAIVEELVAKWDISTVLDYGCGQGQFKIAFDAFETGCPVAEYDPAIIGKQELPSPADLIVCADVLEHVEPDKIDAVLEHIFSLMRIGGYFVISLCETRVFLPDGRNAHLLIKPVEWWINKLSTFDCEIRYCSVRIKKKEIKDVMICIKKL